MAASAKYIGTGSGTLALDESVFAERFHGPLVHEAVRAELAAQRRGTASTQTRGEVRMTGAKAWRQKGTGTLALDDAVFAERFHGPLVHEAVRAELAARRRGTASTAARRRTARTTSASLARSARRQRRRASSRG